MTMIMIIANFTINKFATCNIPKYYNKESKFSGEINLNINLWPVTGLIKMLNCFVQKQMYAFCILAVINLRQHVQQNWWESFPSIYLFIYSFIYLYSSFPSYYFYRELITLELFLQANKFNDKTILVTSLVEFDKIHWIR